jgi:hypothetical protein
MVMPLTIPMAIRIIKAPLRPSPIAQRHQRQRRNRSWWLVSPRCPYRTTNCRLGTPRAVSVFHLSYISYNLVHVYCKRVGSSPLSSSQTPAVRTPPLKFWEMDHLVLSGCATGMGRYRPIHLYPPCNVELELDPNGWESGS